MKSVRNFSSAASAAKGHIFNAAHHGIEHAKKYSNYINIIALILACLAILVIIILFSIYGPKITSMYNTLTTPNTISAGGTGTWYIASNAGWVVMGTFVFPAAGNWNISVSILYCPSVGTTTSSTSSPYATVGNSLYLFGGTNAVINDINFGVSTLSTELNGYQLPTIVGTSVFVNQDQMTLGGYSQYVINFTSTITSEMVNTTYYVLSYVGSPNGTIVLAQLDYGNAVLTTIPKK